MPLRGRRLPEIAERGGQPVRWTHAGQSIAASANPDRPAREPGRGRPRLSRARRDEDTESDIGPASRSDGITQDPFATAQRDRARNRPHESRWPPVTLSLEGHDRRRNLSCALRLRPQHPHLRGFCAAIIDWFLAELFWPEPQSPDPQIAASRCSKPTKKAQPFYQ